MRAAHFLAATLLASVALTGCSGDEDGDTTAEKATCPPVKGAGVVTVRDDKGALPAANVVSVTGSKGQYRKPLEAVDRVTRALSQAEVATVSRAQGKKRAKAVTTALTDLTGPGSQRVSVHLYAGDPASARAIADLYRAGLGAGSTVRIAASAREALAKAQGKDVALVPLTDLATFTDASVADQDLGGQLQSVATAALAKKLAVGSPGELSVGPAVVVATSVAARQVATVADLASVCGTVELAHHRSDAEAASTVATRYRLRTVEVPDVARAIAEGKAVAGIS